MKTLDKEMYTGKVIKPHSDEVPKGKVWDKKKGNFWTFFVTTKTGKVIKKYIHIK